MSLRPICAVYGLVIGALLSGSFVVEFVTAWPGLGRLMYEALRARDIYLVAGCAAMGASLLAIGTLIGDLLLAAADPRVREGGRGLRRAGVVLLAVVIAAAIAAPWLAPNEPISVFRICMYAPPTRVHLFGEGATLYIYTQRLVSRRERRFEDDRSRPVPLRCFSDGRLITADAQAGAPLLLLGADGYGRDIFSRLLYGGRATLAVALIATLAAAWLGALIGGIAGSRPAGSTPCCRGSPNSSSCCRRSTWRWRCAR